MMQIMISPTLAKKFTSSRVNLVQIPFIPFFSKLPEIGSDSSLIDQNICVAKLQVFWLTSVSMPKSNQATVMYGHFRSKILKKMGLSWEEFSLSHLLRWGFSGNTAPPNTQPTSSQGRDVDGWYPKLKSYEWSISMVNVVLGAAWLSFPIMQRLGGQRFGFLYHHLVLSDLVRVDGEALEGVTCVFTTKKYNQLD